MRIISKFSDYYDGLQRAGFDSELIYTRAERDSDHYIKLTHAGSDLIGASDSTQHMSCVEPRRPRIAYIKKQCVPIVFCGKLHWRYLVDVTAAFGEQDVKTRFFGSDRKEVRDAAFEAFKIPSEPEKKKRYRWMKKGFKSFNEINRETFMAAAESYDWLSAHRLTKCPVLSFRVAKQEERRWQYTSDASRPMDFRLLENPVLQDVGFYQVKPAFEAYQEIAMFLGGVLGSEGRDMVALTDKDLHRKHGFDKWSFKKMPENGVV